MIKYIFILHKAERIKMARITIKGLLIQDRWSEKLSIMSCTPETASAVERSTYQFVQREFTVEVEESSLRVKTSDSDSIREILEAQELKDLYYRKIEAEVTVVALQKQIDDKLALNYEPAEF